MCLLKFNVYSKIRFLIIIYCISSECIYIPGSSKCEKFVPVHQKKLPKGRNFTYLEDPGVQNIYIYILDIYIYIYLKTCLKKITKGNFLPSVLGKSYL